MRRSLPRAALILLALAVLAGLAAFALLSLNHGGTRAHGFQPARRAAPAAHGSRVL